MRQKIAAGNWKMNLTLAEAKGLAKGILSVKSPPGIQVILGVPYIYLNEINQLVQGIGSVEVAAQNCHQANEGAFTGEISIPMLKSIGLSFVIVGHSERREIFNETDQIIKEKVDSLLSAHCRPIFCCGEALAIRDQDKQNDFVKKQLENSIFHLNETSFSRLIIAYEPIWAIGTGRTASPDQAQDMHRFIRSCIAKNYNTELAESISILYGGSVKPDNANELFSQPDVDGGLVGGASLKMESFISIINAF